jgi:hypothetical protein
LGELLHETNKLGGRIISVTTDGFLTDIEDLESKLLKTVNYDKGLLKHYRSTRNYLTTVRKTPVDPENPEIIDESLLDPTALEIKTVTEGAMFS